MNPHYRIGLPGKARLSHAQVLSILSDHGLIPIGSRLLPFGFPAGTRVEARGAAGVDPSDAVHALTGCAGGASIHYARDEVVAWLAAQ